MADALMTTLRLPNIWPNGSTSNPKTHQKLQGRALPTMPKTSNLTPMLKDIIAREINDKVSTADTQGEISKIRDSRKLTTTEITSHLINLLDKTMNTIATKHLGETRSASNHTFAPPAGSTTLDLWDEVHQATGTWLKRTRHLQPPSPIDTEPTLLALFSRLKSASILIPTHRSDLQRW
jgi:hypothetical protein